MADHKITDFVDQSAIDGLKRLKEDMLSVKDTYIQTATELAKGLKVSVDGLDQLERLTTQVANLQRQAADATQRHSTAVTEQGQILGRTTAVIAEALQNQNRLNREVRQSKVDYVAVMDAVEKVNGAYEQHVHRLIQIEAETKANKKSIAEYQKLIAEGKDKTGEYSAKVISLTAANRQLAQEKAKLNSLLRAEEKEMISNAGSYDEMAQQLEVLKKAYKALGAEQRQSAEGKELLETINQLDTELKHMAEDMGEHQRNVGDYAIAFSQGAVSVQEFSNALNMNCTTINDVIEQNKQLEDARRNLNKEDANYAETLDMINAKMAENRLAILDVSDILQTHPKTIAEAENQNKQLAEALKLVDLTSDDAKEKIDAYNEKIAANRQLIEENTEALHDNSEASEGLADQLLETVGLSDVFGSSLRNLADNSSGNMLDGLKTKTEAFGKTLMGLLSNPWVLAILGIVGVVAGAKWWFDYNKGLVEASKLTQDFTGLTGSEMKAVRNEVQSVADVYGKDFQETLEAANAMSQQFGISIQESLKLMEDGFASGADVNGEFLENIKEYPAYFKEAGLSASEFIAITTQANKAGIYSDKGIDVIKEGNLRIREMTKATAEALDGIGISSKEVQQALADGSKTTFDIMQEVSEKLAEFPEASSEVGTALADIFGGPGEDAGLQYILMLKDMDTNLDNVKDRAGQLAELQNEQLQSQIELENTIASVFDATGGSFESMTTKAKIFVNDGIIAIIKGCVDIVNWFIRLYNKSIAVRAIFNSIVNSFKTIWATVKFVLSQIIDGFKALGDIIEGVFTLDLGKIKSGYQKGLNAFKDNFTSLVKEIKKNTEDAVRETLDGEMQEVTLDVKVNHPSTHTPANKPKGKDGYKVKQTDEEKKAEEKAAKDAEKRAKEELKRIHELEDAKVEVMEEGHQKDLALIRQKFKKKLDEIKGNGETEQALRVQLAEQCAKEIADCELKYQRELAKINLANRLASVKEGSKEELNLKLAQLEANRAAEIEAAKKSGADVSIINAKFNKQRVDMLEDYANKQIENAQQSYAVEAAIADNAYNKQLNKLNSKYAEELKAAGKNQELREAATQRHEEAVARLSENYAQQRAQAAIVSLEKILKTENLSAEERAQLEDQLAKAKIDAEKAATDAVIAENQRQVDADTKAFKKRMENVQKWLQVASDGLNAINDLASAIFDAKIERIEAEQEANTEAGEAEQERITELVEKNVITEEEGEARKRAAEAKTQKKEEELEKKKQQLKYKQAVWDKANSLAQAGIATALAITQALPNVVLAAIAGAMGAIQIATILATPIPKYAKGTKDHPGGLAIVGDGGRQEVVSYGGNMFLTPDTPTLIDMPKGAEVFPDAD
ncbi:MAG: hypothetical protein NC453_22970, partial [Muribaculum sp.]|nr:hypothetical protein [Muribaculum sp.]